MRTRRRLEINLSLAVGLDIWFCTSPELKLERCLGYLTKFTAYNGI
jgi:hypothetical protein